ncbi:MAG: hypothetical protein AB8B55_16085 [Mariniblastus sp.]
MNPLLKKLFDCDRADHKVSITAGTEAYTDLRIRDAERRKQVRSILCEERITNCVDQYHAAWVLNHGDQPADAELAYQLAERSLDAGHEPAKWLYAAAFDRCCMYRGQPQKFGTQIVPDGERYRLWETIAETTDQERGRFNVPPIAEMHERAARDSLVLGQPPMESAPDWLVAAIARWEQDADV